MEVLFDEQAIMIFELLLGINDSNSNIKHVCEQSNNFKPNTSITRSNKPEGNEPRSINHYGSYISSRWLQLID